MHTTVNFIIGTNFKTIGAMATTMNPLSQVVDPSPLDLYMQICRCLHLLALSTVRSLPSQIYLVPCGGIESSRESSNSTAHSLKNIFMDSSTWRPYTWPISYGPCMMTSASSIFCTVGEMMVSTVDHVMKIPCELIISVILYSNSFCNCSLLDIF